MPQSDSYETEETFDSGDQIGVLLDFNTATLTFSKNKDNIQMIKLEAHHMNQDFYPSVGICSPEAIVQLMSSMTTEESCWSKTKKCLCNPIESCCGKTMECVCAPFKSCWEMIQPCVSYVWDLVSDFFDYYNNHLAMLKFILTNVALSLFDVGSDINTAITFLM